MKQPPQIFHGEWWVPATEDRDLEMFYINPQNNKGLERKYTGNLVYYEDEDSILELVHTPSNFRASLYHQNNVMWGADANGHIFTLFDVVMKEDDSMDITSTSFVVSLILVGEYVLSLNDAFVSKCVVQFPYLRNWAFHDNLIYQKSESNNTYILPKINPNNCIAELSIDNDVKWVLKENHSQNKTRFDLSIKQTTELVIESPNGISLRDCLNQIVEFSQFLSIALYGSQSPSSVLFSNSLNNLHSVLLYKKEDSINPNSSSLIKFDALKNKIPDMLRNWHENYSDVAPISNYLIESLQKNKTFDVPDFLIIAQALDGYHKRFVNKKNGKDRRKYEDEIKILLKQFKDVDCVQKCHIDPKSLADSRNKYSHLYPDNENSSAVEGEDLFLLTEKCKILLTCCILNMMGLTNEEINICCDNSPIQEIIEAHSFEFEDD